MWKRFWLRDSATVLKASETFIRAYQIDLFFNG